MTAASSRALIDALIEAVWLVEPVNLHIVEMNQSALDLSGLSRHDMLGRPVVELTGTPEDQYFWEDVAAGLSESIHSETLIRSADGVAIPVERKVSRIWLDAATPLFMVGLRDLHHQRRFRAAGGQSGLRAPDRIAAVTASGQCGIRVLFRST